MQKVKREVISKEPKTEASKRTLPLTNYMVDVFRRRSIWIKENKLQLGQIYNHEWDGFFSVDKLGNIIDDQKVSGRFRDTITRILKDHKDIDKITFHDLRHSCSSWLLHKGASMKEIQEILGHSTMSTTADIYSHITLDKKREALEKLH